jgi:hypothetical protein
MHTEAVAHARHAVRAAALTWTHLDAEYTQDIEKVLATLATDEPLTWTLPQLVSDDGTVAYLAGTDLEEIRGQYEAIRQFVEIHDWQALVEIRQSWYVLTHGVVTMKSLATGAFTRNQTVTMFPVGRDGILGEVQVGAVVLREHEVPAPAAPDGLAGLPQRRLDALAFHNRYIEALRREDVAGIVAAHHPKGAATIRNYLTDTSTVLNTSGAAALGGYFSELFDRYRVRDVELVNRVAESWYVFAELLWTVEERGGARRTLAFCTAETAPLDADGRFWIRTGVGSDPVEP